MRRIRFGVVGAAVVIAGGLAGCASGASTLPTDVIVAPSAFSETGMHLKPAAPAADSCTTTPTGSFALTRVDVARKGTDVVVALQVPSLPTFERTAAATLHFTDRHGRHGGTFTTQWVDQNLAPDVVVAEDATKRHAYVETDPVIHATSITTAFPALLVDRLGAGWRWTVTTTVDGKRQDTCAPRS